MNLFHVRSILTAAFAGGLLLSPGHTVAADDPLAPLAWLTGCWTLQGAEPGSGEQWTPLAGGTLLGISRTVRRGVTTSFEFMRIEADAQGQPVFHAQPSGKPPDSFPAISVLATEVVFENPAHAFPQRVIYRFVAPTTLQARIEGLRNGVPRGIDYPMERVSCDALRPQAPAAEVAPG